MPQINTIMARKNKEVKKKLTYIFLFLKLPSHIPGVAKDFFHLMGELPAQLLSS